jgi:hypothetical protein
MSRTPTNNDPVTHVEYDLFGRHGKNWLPFALSGNDGAYIGGTISSTSASFYIGNVGIPSESIAYSRNNFDKSPLNRIVKEFGPGANWQKKELLVISKMIIIIMMIWH